MSEIENEQKKRTSGIIPVPGRPGLYQYISRKPTVDGRKPKITYYTQYRLNHKLIQYKLGDSIKDKLTPKTAYMEKIVVLSKLRIGELDLSKLLSDKTKNITLNEFWEEKYLKSCELEKSIGPKTSTYNNYIKPLFGNKIFSKITTYDIDVDIINNMKKNKKANQTILSVLSILSDMFNRAKKWDIYTGENPVENIEKKSLPLNNKRSAILTLEQCSEITKRIYELNSNIGILQLLLLKLDLEEVLY